MKTIKDSISFISNAFAQIDELDRQYEEQRKEILRLEDENEENINKRHALNRDVLGVLDGLYNYVVLNFPVSSFVNVNLNGTIRNARVVGHSKEQMKVFVDVYGKSWAFGGPPSIEARNVAMDFDDIFKVQ